MSKTNIKRFLAFSCFHSPYPTAEAMRWVLDEITDYKPHVVVCLGDLFDASAASVHPDEVRHTLLDEYAVASNFLEQVRRAAPTNASFVWTLGNHDDNIQRCDPRRIPEGLRDIVNWNNTRIYGDEFRKWKQYPYEKGAQCVYSLGQVGFFHGFDAGGNSDETESLQMSYVTGAHPWRLWIRGHTHRPVQVTQAKKSARVRLPHFYANAGTLGFGDQTPEYMTRKDVSCWGQAIVYGEVNTAKKLHECNGVEWSASTYERMVPCEKPVARMAKCLS
tara:strand:+ start:14264 stop:15091 length:828 start_codon:yes stop_codon:yes gene_type:complete